MAATNTGITVQTVPDNVREIGARAHSREMLIAKGMVGAYTVLFVLFFVLPLGMLFLRSLYAPDGTFVGLDNYIRYSTTPALASSLWNSIWVSVVATAFTVPIAFFFAYGLTRACIPGKQLFRSIILIPVLAPSLLPALSLVYLFGNQGFLRDWLMGNSIYGPIGIIIASVFFNLPQAVMILITSLSLADKRVYEAAEVLGTPTRRVWSTITLPQARLGLISCALVIFTKVITDFGVVIVIGGPFNMLATDIYRQVIGQQNFNMGAVIGVILIIPALIAYIANRWAQNRQMSSMTARAVPLAPTPSRGRDIGFFLYCCFVAFLMLVMLGMAFWGSFITFWPYNLSLTLENYNFERFDPGGWGPFWVSLRLALLTMVVGTIIVFVGAWCSETLWRDKPQSKVYSVLATLPLGVPGLVLGLSYLVFFNEPNNPANFLLGTLFLMAMSTIMHYYTICHMTAVTALKQLDREFEAVEASLKVSRLRGFFKITLPICVPAVLDIAIYLFLTSMATLSALIFIYDPSTRVAAVAMVNINDAGFTSAAAAMAMLIVSTSLAFLTLHRIVEFLIARRTQRWRVGA